MQTFEKDLQRQRAKEQLVCLPSVNKFMCSVVMAQAIRQDFLQLAAEHARNAAKVGKEFYWSDFNSHFPQSAGPPAPVSRPSAALPATATPLGLLPLTPLAASPRIRPRYVPRVRAATDCASSASAIVGCGLDNDRSKCITASRASHRAAIRRGTDANREARRHGGVSPSGYDRQRRGVITV